MELGAARTRAVTTAAGSISMCATYAILIALLHRAFDALRVGVQVETVAFSAISSVHDMRNKFTEHAGLALHSGDAMGVAQWHWPYRHEYVCMWRVNSSLVHVLLYGFGDPEIPL